MSLSEFCFSEVLSGLFRTPSIFPVGVEPEAWAEPGNASSPSHSAPKAVAPATPTPFRKSRRFRYRVFGVISDDGMKLESLLFTNIGPSPSLLVDAYLVDATSLDC